MLDAYSKPDANLSGHQNAITPDVILLPSKRSMSLEDQTNAQNLSARDQDGLQARITTLEKQLSTCQHALADIEERYRALFMNTLLGFAYHRIVLDAEQKPVDYIFLEVNDAFEAFTGLKRDNLMHKRVTEVLPGIERSAFDWIGYYGDVALTGKIVSFEQYSEPLQRWYTVSAYSPRREYFVTLFQDITERKRAEEHLARISKAVESTSDAISLIGIDGKALYHNPAFINLFGYTVEELNARGGIEWLYTGEPQLSNQIMASIQSQQSWQHEVTLRARDGGELPILLRVNAVLEDTGTPIGSVVVCTDISERKQAEAEQAQLQAQMMEAQRKTMRELSTPLIPIADNVVIMPLIGAIDDERAQQILETLLQGVVAQHADRVILDITGVRVMDTHIASVLMHAAQALKLLGSQVILTGIQPRIAQTLVELAVDLRDIVTLGTLQAGITYALKR